MAATKEEMYKEENVNLARKLFAAYISHKECIGLDDALKRHASEVPDRRWLLLATM